VCPVVCYRIPNWKPEIHILKIICLEMDSFEHYFTIILCCPLALVKVLSSSITTLGEADIRKW